MSVAAISRLTIVARWQPNAQERLQTAAMELFEERGYDRTTVQEIAERAGLTERTYFRYFADKREVLFSRAKELEASIVAAITAAPAVATPLDAVVSALEAIAPSFDGRRASALQRLLLITEHAELYERELIKLATLAAAIAECLQSRGVNKAAARLIGETGIALFKNAFEEWVVDPAERDFVHHVRAALGELRLATVSPRTGGAPGASLS